MAPQTATKAATPVTVATVWTVIASEPVNHHSGVASHASPGKKACDGITGRGSQ